MSFARVATAAVWGSQVTSVQVEVDIAPGLPLFHIIGLPDKQIDEARERVRSALKNTGLALPLGRITVNLAPSRLPKQGTSFDLAIALAILQASNKAPVLPAAVWVLGELSLDGNIRPVSNLLPVLVQAFKQNVQGCILPFANLEESRLIPECPTLFAEALSQLLDSLSRPLLFKKSSIPESPFSLPGSYQIDQVAGQTQAKRIMEIAIAGGHNLFLTGSPGSGKTMLVKAAQQLFPPLSRQESLEVIELQASQRELDKEKRLRITRPFRSPHHSSSVSALLGGGITPSPGEISLAHQGLLFLDEFAEFSRASREALRQPLEDKKVRLIRRGQEYLYPARALVVAAQNNCPCGLGGLEGELCNCTPGQLKRYASSISEPLLDRFDLYCPLPPVKMQEWGRAVRIGEGQKMAERIQQARTIQNERFPGQKLNSEMTQTELKEYAKLRAQSKELLEKASQQFFFSARGLRAIVSVARTIADLAGNSIVEKEHLQEALLYRRRVSKW